jgi:hypothetical protein
MRYRLTIFKYDGAPPLSTSRRYGAKTIEGPLAHLCHLLLKRFPASTPCWWIGDRYRIGERPQLAELEPLSRVVRLMRGPATPARPLGAHRRWSDYTAADRLKLLLNGTKP